MKKLKKDLKSPKRIIGPFLGPRGTTGISIGIGLPDHKINKLTCKLIESDQCVKPKICDIKKDDIFCLFQFKFENLDPQKEYKYKFYDPDENQLDLGNKLKYADCKFRVLGEDKNSSFVMLSCHNPFEEEKGSADEGWAMWKKLNSFLKENNSVRLILLGGDQVYNDDLEKTCIENNGTKSNLSENEIKNKFISQYQKYWEDISYRKIFASIPSLAMWDDHDITDGWGGREESFLNKSSSEFKKHWWNYFLIAKEAFEKYQFSRNDDKKIHNLPEGVFSSFLDWGKNRFILCDFRSEKNSRKKNLWSEEHKNAVMNFIKNSPEKIKKIFFLSPVVPLRTNFKGDSRLGIISLSLFKLRKWTNKNNFIFIKYQRCILILALLIFVFSIFIPLLKCTECILESSISTVSLSIIQAAFFITSFFIFLSYGIFYLLRCVSKIPHLPDLSDDIEDGLSSKTNLESLKEILDILITTIKDKDKDKEIFILSGDIHLGGLTEILDTNDNDEATASILQIVSSPIAYKPMPKQVAGFTTTSSEMVLREVSDSKRLFARNIFYISKRNFVQIIPDKIDKAEGIKFFLEDHKVPLVFPYKFYPSLDSDPSSLPLR